MKSVTYPLLLDEDLYARIVTVAEDRHQTVATTFQDIIHCGLVSLPPDTDTTAAVVDTWSKLGPPPEIDYDRI